MEFINTVNGYTFDKELNYDFVDSIIELVNKIKEAVGISQTYFNFKDLPKNLGYVADALLGAYDEWDEKFRAPEGYVAERKGGLFAALTEGFSSENYNLEAVEQFINLLYKLSEAIRTFYETDDFGDYKYQSALENLKDIDWNGILPDNITKFSITPVITMSEADQSLLSRIEALSGLAPSMTLSLAEGIDIATRTDFEGWFTDLSDKITTMDSHLSNMRFVINGSEVAHTIYPDISYEAARQEMLDLRTSGKS